MRISTKSKLTDVFRRAMRSQCSSRLSLGLLIIVGLIAACAAKPVIPPVITSSPKDRLTPGLDLSTPRSVEKTEPAQAKTLVQTIQPTSLPIVGLTPDMKASLDALLAAGGDWHAAIHGPDGALVYAYRANTVIHPASTIKIAIGMLILVWLEGQDGGLEKNLLSGPINAGRSYAQLLHAMLVPSEEDAAQILQDAAVQGLGWRQINQLLVKWGAPNTRLVPRRSTALDMSNLLIGLYSRNLPSPKASRIILDLLAIKTSGDTVRLWKLKNVLPEGAIIYNKRGSLTDPVIVADVGIIVLPGRGPFYICIFGYSDGKIIFEDLDKTIGEFALKWYQLDSEK